MLQIFDDDDDDGVDDVECKSQRPSGADTNIEGVASQSQGQPHYPII